MKIITVVNNTCFLISIYTCVGGPPNHQDYKASLLFIHLNIIVETKMSNQFDFNSNSVNYLRLPSKTYDNLQQGADINY